MGPVPHAHMPDDVKGLYLEAREIGTRSPRSAAALLRLALEKLTTGLTDADKLNDAIAELVSAGMSTSIQ